MKRFNVNILPEAGVSFDTLLAYATETLSEAERTRIEQHLRVHETDREVLQGIQLYLAEEPLGTDGLEADLEEMMQDFDALLDAYMEEQESGEDVLPVQEAKANDRERAYEQAERAAACAARLEGRGLASMADRSPDGVTGIRFILPFLAEHYPKAVALRKRVAAFGYPGGKLRTLRHALPFYDARISPEGERVLTRSSDYVLRLWKGDQEVAAFDHQAPITDMRFSPRDSYLLTASEDHLLRLWDDEGALLQTYQHPAPLKFAKFTSHGSRILSGDAHGNLSLWDLPGMLYRNFVHTAPLLDGSLAPNGRQVLGINEQHTASLWDLQGNELWRAPHVLQAIFIAPSSELLVLTADQTLRRWDLFGNEICAFPHREQVQTACAAPDSSHVLTTSTDDCAYLWDLEGRERACLPHEHPLLLAMWNETSDQVITLCEDHSLHLWNVAGEHLHSHALSDWLAHGPG